LTRPAAAIRVYADATALIGLARIDRLDLLSLLPTPICATTRVWQEVAADPTKAGVVAIETARAEGLIAIVDEGDSDAYPQLDPGESSVLSAAALVGGAVIVDERKARALIQRDAFLNQRIAHVTGIIGLILLAKREGRVPAVRPLVDELTRQSFRIGPGLYRRILTLANED
jgi:predicted nucleic acid-binding protein